MIVIAGDDGHGLTRNGAFHPTAGKRTPKFADGHQVYENEFNRMACKYFLQAVERCGMRGVACAAGDEDVPLADRAKVAKQAGADALVSFHYNAGEDYGVWGERKQGVSVLIHATYASAKSQLLAEKVLSRLMQGREQKRRGVGKNNFYIVNERNTGCPSVLVEAGFMDNPREAGWMTEPAFHKEVGEEACQGVCDFFGVTYVAPGEAEKGTGCGCVCPVCGAKCSAGLVG